MTREELYQSIYTHDTIYLPPHEETSAPLEVELGCSWHKCTFCDFTKDKFQIHPFEKIEYNIQILGLLQPQNERLFLLGENAFCMGTDYMLKIIELKNKYMPNVKSFAMYSRIDDILQKSREELVLIKSKGLSGLHIGIESGSDSILLERNKGVTTAQALEALNMLDEVGIDYHITLIPGLGGRTFSRMHALETAAFLNKIHPKSVWCLKLKLWEDTLLYKEAQKGHFDMMTPEEIILEERLMIEHLTLENCFYVDSTVLDTYTIQGNLPQQKQQLLDAIDYLLLIHKS